MDGVIAIELCQQSEQGLRRGIGIKPVRQRLEATLIGHLSFRADIDLASRIFADDDNGDAGAQSGAREKVCRACLDAGNDDVGIAEWGGLSSFSSKAIDIISNIVAANG